jgi:hypothetical protein
MCCMDGEVQLPLLKKPSTTFQELLNPSGDQCSKNIRHKLEVVMPYLL